MKTSQHTIGYLALCFVILVIGCAKPIVRKYKPHERPDIWPVNNDNSFLILLRDGFDKYEFDFFYNENLIYTGRFKMEHSTGSSGRVYVLNATSDFELVIRTRDHNHYWAIPIKASKKSISLRLKSDLTIEAHDYAVEF